MRARMAIGINCTDNHWRVWRRDQRRRRSTGCCLQVRSAVAGAMGPDGLGHPPVPPEHSYSATSVSDRPSSGILMLRFISILNQHPCRGPGALSRYLWRRFEAAFPLFKRGPGCELWRSARSAARRALSLSATQNRPARPRLRLAPLTPRRLPPLELVMTANRIPPQRPTHPRQPHRATRPPPVSNLARPARTVRPRATPGACAPCLIVGRQQDQITNYGGVTGAATGRVWTTDV